MIPSKMGLPNLDSPRCSWYVHGMIKQLPTDHTTFYPTVKKMSDGRFCVQFESGMFRTLLGKVFGLMLTPETTRAEADALASMLDKHCSHLIIASLEHEGMTDAERQWLTEMYDDMGLLDRDYPRSSS